MDYKFIKDPRSRFANFGNNVVSNNNNNSIDYSEDFQIPSYSAFRTRIKTDPLKDFHWELYSRDQNPTGEIQRKRTTGFAKRKKTQFFESSDQQPNRNIKTEKKIDPSIQLKKEIGDLKGMISQFTKKSETQTNSITEPEKIIKYIEKSDRSEKLDKYEELFLEKKILQLMPKYSSQLNNQPQQPQYPPPPQYYPMYYPPPPSPYGQFPPYFPREDESRGNKRQRTEKPQLIMPYKKKQDPRRRLRKAIFVVSFPFLLKKYSEKLRVIRKKNFDQVIGQKFDVSVEIIKQWFLESAKKVITVLIQKQQIQFNFINEPNSKVEIEKIKLNIELLNMLTNQLLLTAEASIIEQFVDFIELTAYNSSFVPDNFLTTKQLQYLSFSQKNLTLQANKSIQQIQIISFVFIKVFVYNIFLQPWKVDAKLKNDIITSNLYLLGSIFYHCAAELINKRLKDKDPTYFKRGNMLQKITAQALKFKPDSEIQKQEYISGMVPKEHLKPIISYNYGKFWKSMQQTLQKIVSKIYSSVIAKHKSNNQHYKQLQQSS